MHVFRKWMDAACWIGLRLCDYICIGCNLCNFSFLFFSSSFFFLFFRFPFLFDFSFESVFPLPFLPCFRCRVSASQSWFFCETSRSSADSVICRLFPFYLILFWQPDRYRLAPLFIIFVYFSPLRAIYCECRQPTRQMQWLADGNSVGMIEALSFAQIVPDGLDATVRLRPYHLLPVTARHFREGTENTQDKNC